MPESSRLNVIFVRIQTTRTSGGYVISEVAIAYKSVGAGSEVRTSLS